MTWLNKLQMFFKSKMDKKLIFNSSIRKENMSRVIRKPTFCICENKDADQLRGNREADQRLWFRYINSTIPLLPNTKFQASGHLMWLYSLVCVGPGQKPRIPVFSQRGSFDHFLLWRDQRIQER